MNANPLPPLDMILCRDVMSFMPPIDQKRLLGDFIDKLKASGIVLIGASERMGEGWNVAGSEAVPAFRKD
jgi:chemotaxis methyl-accepting protein methylase